ncbi:MAG: hypothetical protein J07HQW1_02587 [Haloquadratum walsbyi J07HQW1]|uniref:Uncharacterized protein n=1 Tax=Haloquadratum walsbyi J07HQW1 TaxID=1238424 RepID=U1N7T4_9EURY|nr:MAG: hypothetical protein J07HQW1_02587 [Haloquadratum walsbyi J07HQW1]
MLSHLRFHTHSVESFCVQSCGVAQSHERIESQGESADTDINGEMSITISVSTRSRELFTTVS